MELGLDVNVWYFFFLIFKVWDLPRILRLVDPVPKNDSASDIGSKYSKISQNPPTLTPTY